jgi:hypothetical protein
VSRTRRRGRAFAQRGSVGCLLKRFQDAPFPFVAVVCARAVWWEIGSVLIFIFLLILIRLFR